MLRVNALEILIFTFWLLISSEHFQVINIFVKKLHSNLHTCIKNMTEENKKFWISFYIFSIRVHVKAKKFVFLKSKSWERDMGQHCITVFFFTLLQNDKNILKRHLCNSPWVPILPPGDRMTDAKDADPLHHGTTKHTTTHNDDHYQQEAQTGLEVVAS